MSPLTGIFLDTSDIEEIRRFHALGVIRGVTTNPTILVKDGLTGGGGPTSNDTPGRSQGSSIPYLCPSK